MTELTYPAAKESTQSDARSGTQPPTRQSPSWSAEELEAMVADLSPSSQASGNQATLAAVFDCDGTLWNGDSGYGFMLWSIEQGLVSRSTSDWIDTRHRAYLSGQISEEAICGEMTQMYAGLREQELRKAAREYVHSHVLPRVFPEMRRIVELFAAKGGRLWAVSSTNKWVVTEGVRELGIAEKRVLASEVKVVDGLITSELVDVPTGEGKARALRRAGLPTPDAVFGNSVHDLAMLELARRAFPINPSPMLLEACRARGWGHYLPEAAASARHVVTGE